MSATALNPKNKKKTNSSGTEEDRVTAYARAVVAGKIVAGPHVRNACRRHLDDLDRADIRFSRESAERAIRFFETKLRLSEGQFEDRPFNLSPAQDFIVGSLFGWQKIGGARRFRRAYVEQGKGNGKSPLAGGIGLYGLMADGEAGAEIYSAGATKEQAGILFRDAVKMVDKSPDLERRVKKSGGPGREFNIAFRNSFFRPVSRETRKTGSGPRPHFALVDELHEHPDGGIIEMLERGFKFRIQPLLLMITNSGSNRNSICWTEHDYAIKVAAGNREAKDDDAHYLGERWGRTDETFSYVCALDTHDDPLEDPSCWPKANPLLGVTITEDYLAGVVAQAKDIPAKLNGILRLHFCRWTDADTAWISRAALEAVLADFDPADFTGREISVGADLGATKDMASLGFVVQTGSVERSRKDRDGVERLVRLPTYAAWTEQWTPAETVKGRALQDRAPYETWIEQGHLNATPGSVVRLDHLAARVAEVQIDYRIKALGYDAYAFKRYFEPALDEVGVTCELIEHPQGGKRRAAPTDRQKSTAATEGKEAEGLWMPGSVNALELLILERRIQIRRNPVTISALMSVAIERDPFDNRWLSKRKSTNRIDPTIALTTAVGVAEMVGIVGLGHKSIWDRPELWN